MTAKRFQAEPFRGTIEGKKKRRKKPTSVTNCSHREMYPWSLLAKKRYNGNMG